MHKIKMKTREAHAREQTCALPKEKKRPGVASPPPLPLDPNGTHLMAHPFHFTRYSMRP